MCRYKLSTHWQNFTEIYLTWVKILQKVLGGYFFESQCSCNTLNIQLRTFSDVLSASNCRKLGSDGRKQSPEKNDTKLQSATSVSDPAASCGRHDERLHDGCVQQLSSLHHCRLRRPSGVLKVSENESRYFSHPSNTLLFSSVYSLTFRCVSIVLSPCYQTGGCGIS